MAVVIENVQLSVQLNHLRGGSVSTRETLARPASIKPTSRLEQRERWNFVLFPSRPSKPRFSCLLQVRREQGPSWYRVKGRIVSPRSENVTCCVQASKNKTLLPGRSPVWSQTEEIHGGFEGGINIFSFKNILTPARSYLRRGEPTVELDLSKKFASREYARHERIERSGSFLPTSRMRFHAPRRIQTATTTSLSASVVADLHKLIAIRAPVRAFRRRSTLKEARDAFTDDRCPVCSSILPRR